MDLVLICGAFNLLAAQAPTTNANILLRRYSEGEKLTYQMKGINEAWHYEIQADGVVKRDSAGTFFEEYRWSNLISDNQKVSLSPASVDFREQVSLDPNYKLVLPNLSQVDHRLIGPITDFLTFYVDLCLAAKSDKLANPGDHFYVKRGTPNSWADGNYVLIGEDSIDFEINLKAINRPDNTATILVRHVPPEKPEVNLPAEWMRKPVADSGNNFVQVQKTKDGKYLATVGKETFNVEIKSSLIDGKILSAKLDNRLVAIERECVDASLTTCSDPTPHSIRRQIEILRKPN
ncbi:MAG: hypothetical protein WA817_01970 [Candidatus Acidiferrum sp.]